MFVRTQRLTLRPAWPEDAAELAAAIGHERVVRNLARAPWPYPVEAAERFCASFGDPKELKFLAFEHDAGTLRLVGGVGIGPLGEEPHELGYWIAPPAWGRGFAVEAASGAIRAAGALGVRRVAAGHFIDNPASGRVLRKLGFKPTGRVAPLFSLGRNAEVPAARFELELAGAAPAADPEPRMAA
jgi:RimJ/RimL family protein N-acetyltransferase